MGMVQHLVEMKMVLVLMKIMIGVKTGKIKNRKTRGISIITEDYPDDDREGWVDIE